MNENALIFQVVSTLGESSSNKKQESMRENDFNQRSKEQTSLILKCMNQLLS